MRRLVLAFAVSLAAVAAAPAETADKTAPQSAAELHLSFAPVVKKVRPAVVNVYASRVERQARNPLFDDPIFRQFFGDAGPGVARRAVARLRRHRRLRAAWSSPTITSSRA